MSATPNSIRTKPKLGPLRIVSSVLFFLFGILSAISAFTMVGLHFEEYQYITDNVIYLFPEAEILANFDLFRLVTSILAPVIAIVAALLGFVSMSRWLQSILGISLFVIVFPVSWVWQLWAPEALELGSITAWTQDVRADPNFYYWNFQDTPLGWMALVFAVLAVLMSILASSISPKKLNLMAEETALDFAGSGQVNSGTSNSSSPQSNLSNLPLFALIGAFVVPLAGIIIGHLSLSYMKKGQLSSENKGMATAGLILGYVFVGLSFLVGLIFLVALVVTSLNRGF